MNAIANVLFSLIAIVPNHIPIAIEGQGDSESGDWRHHQRKDSSVLHTIWLLGSD